MSQDDTPDLVAPQAGKVPPETVALRAQPRPVTRLNRRTLAALAGGVSVAVLGATIWSLQSPKPRGGSDSAELYNVDRVSRSERLDRLPSDYSKLPPPSPPPPELGPPVPGDLGPAIMQSQRPSAPSYTPLDHDPAEAERLARLKEAEEAAASSVFFRTGSPQPSCGCACTTCLGFSNTGGLRSAGRRSGINGCTARRPDRRAEPAGAKGGVPAHRCRGNSQFWEPTAAGVAVPGYGWHSDCRRAGHRHQIGSSG